jgi:hypothetical protein
MIIIIIFFIILFYLIINSYDLFFPTFCREHENFDNDKIKIYSRDELINILLKDSDNYVKSFNNNDFMARNVNNQEEYNKSIINSCVDINYQLKNKIEEQIQKANSKFKSYNIIGFDGEKCKQLPWNIGIVDGSQYENGYPHTRNNIVIIHLSIINDNLYSTLIHEKVHIYQKIFPNDIQIYLNNNNFIKVNTQIINRANPDIDNNIYKDKNNNVLYCIYNNNPKNISDIRCSHSEHPFEFMAYQIQHDLST